jgi:putative ABC transport system permease protein
MPFVQDVRYAIRLLLKRPGFALVAILTLALGIGATTSIFTVVEAVLLRPLPFPDPDRLVQVRITGQRGGDFPLPDTDFLAWRTSNDAAERVAIFDVEAVNVTGIGEPERLSGAIVSDQFFRLLGVAPEIGRLFEDGEDRPGAPRAAIISHALWKRRFGGRVDVIGRPVTLNGAVATIVGVMPPSFAFPQAGIEVWPLTQVNPPRRRGPFYSTGLARLKPDATIDRLRADLDRVTADMKRQHPGPDGWNLTARPLHEAVVGDVRRILYVLLGAVGFLLLIATANVANLLLARAAARDREIAVRGALGAGRGRIVGQLLTESVVLALVSGVGGLLLSMWGTRALLALAPDNIPRLGEVRMNLPVFFFALTTATICGVVFGLAPALRASNTPLVETLKEGGRGGMAGLRHRRTQRALVVAEIALALVLSIGAGLMIRSFAALERVSPGFEPSHLLTFRLAVPRTQYDTNDKVQAFYGALLERIESLPGVRAAGLTISLPPYLLQMTDNFMVEGQTLPPNQSAPIGPLVFVDENYFTALGVPLLDGRFFTERDDRGAPLVAIVNEMLAKKYFGRVNPIGRLIKDGGPERPNNPWMRIVGVVGDVKYDGLATPVDPTFYLPFRQNTTTAQFVVVRTASDPRALANSVRAAVAALDKDLPVANVKTMDDLMTEAVGPPRFRTTLVAVFAAIGLLLAATGIYGVMAYAVSERTHELGVRLALGATSGDVLRLVFGEAIALAAIGAAVGIAGAIATTRLMAALLFGVAPTDLVTFATLAGLLVATALAASYVPARRAMRVDPMVALRYE